MPENGGFVSFVVPKKGLDLDGPAVRKANLRRLFVTCGVFTRGFSWLFRGPRFGQNLRVLALEQSSENRGDSRKSTRRKTPIFIKLERFARIASNLRFAIF